MPLDLVKLMVSTWESAQDVVNFNTICCFDACMLINNLWTEKILFENMIQFTNWIYLIETIDQLIALNFVLNDAQNIII